MRKYTNPEAHGFLMEAKACEKIEKDLRRLAEKYKRAVAKEDSIRKAELSTALGYSSEREIQDDYGWDFITEKQYDLYLKIFQEGIETAENHEKSINEIVLSILYRIENDISTDRREWQFSALSPEEQEQERQRAIESQKAWKKKIAEIKQRRDAAKHKLRKL